MRVAVRRVKGERPRRMTRTGQAVATRLSPVRSTCRPPPDRWAEPPAIPAMRLRDRPPQHAAKRERLGAVSRRCQLAVAGPSDWSLRAAGAKNRGGDACLVSAATMARGGRTPRRDSPGTANRATRRRPASAEGKRTSGEASRPALSAGPVLSVRPATMGGRRSERPPAKRARRRSAGQARPAPPRSRETGECAARR